MRLMLSAALLAATAMAWSGSAQAALTATDLGGWPDSGRQAAAVSAMQAVIGRYNAYGNFNSGNDGDIGFKYTAGVPTAQSGYNGIIEFGGTYPNERVAQHESNHWLGSGTTTNWTNQFDANGLWKGAKMNALAAQFDGDGEVIHQSGVHFYPYGLNYDTEVVNSSVLERNIAIEYAQRQDDGLGTAADPWTAKAVTLTVTDTAGRSGFNFFGMWSDNYFAHPNADYYTGNFGIRTPLDTYDPAGVTPSFTFAGSSLTINNKGNASGGLIFQGKGTTGVVTINNLLLDGGTISHQSTFSDLFQLAGKVTVVSASTITPTNGHINVLADVGGTGALTIGDSAAGGVVRFLSTNNTFRGNLNVNGRFELADNADLRFFIRSSGVNNAITGPSADSVLLNGDFQFDLSNASANPGDAWTIVSAVNRTFGATFSVADFNEATPGIWSNTAGYVFTESTGKLTFGGLGGDSALVPEPMTLGLIGLAGLGLLRRR